MQAKKIKSTYYIKLLVLYIVILSAIFPLIRINSENKMRGHVNDDFNKIISFINKDLLEFENDIKNDNTNLPFDLTEGLKENEFYFDNINNQRSLVYYSDSNLKRYYINFNYFEKYYDTLATNYLLVEKDGLIVYSKNAVENNNIVFYLKNSKKIDKALDTNNQTIKQAGYYATFINMSDDIYLVEIIKTNYYITNLIPSIFLYIAISLFITALIILIIKYYYIDQMRLLNKLNKTLYYELELINIFEVNKKGLITSSNDSFKKLFEKRPNLITDLTKDDNWQKLNELNVWVKDKEYTFEHIISNHKHIFINSEYLKLIERQEEDLYFDETTKLPNLNSFKKFLDNPDNVFDINIYTIDIHDFRKINLNSTEEDVKEVIDLWILNIQESLSSEALIFHTQHDVLTIVTKETEDHHLVDAINKTKNELFNILGFTVLFTLAVVETKTLSDLSPVSILTASSLAIKHAKLLHDEKLIRYDEEMENHYLEQEEIERDLQNAVLNNEFIFNFQPQLNIKNNKVESFESLIRWNNPRYRNMSPEKFLKIAEDSNIVYEITTITIDKIIEFIKIIDNERVEVAFNVSPKQLMEQGFIEKLLTKLKNNNIDPRQIVIEITENVFIQSFREVNEKLKTLRKNGVRIHLDDFGSGYSSFRYLRDLDVNVIKIDRFFIKDMNNDLRIRNIVKTIIDLAQNLDLKVIAEGVETKEQLQELKKLKCDYVQGYLVSKAVDANEAKAFLTKKIAI